MNMPSPGPGATSSSVGNVPDPKGSSHMARLDWLFKEQLEAAVRVLDDVADPEGPSRPFIERNLKTGELVAHSIAEEPATKC